MSRVIASALVLSLGSSCISVVKNTCDANPCGVVWDRGPHMTPRAPRPPSDIALITLLDPEPPNARRMGTFRWPLRQGIFLPHSCTAEIFGFLRDKAANLGFDGVMELQASGGPRDEKGAEYVMFCIGTPYVLEP